MSSSSPQISLPLLYVRRLAHTACSCLVVYTNSGVDLLSQLQPKYQRKRRACLALLGFVVSCVRQVACRSREVVWCCGEIPNSVRLFFDTCTAFAGSEDNANSKRGLEVVSQFFQFFFCACSISRIFLSTRGDVPSRTRTVAQMAKHCSRANDK